MLKSVIFAIAGAGLAALTAAPGSSQAQTTSNMETVSVRISYADLNISSREGADKMFGRIRGAARMICGDPSSMVDLGERASAEACIDQTVNDAVQSLGSPTVSALRDRRQGAETFVASR